MTEHEHLGRILSIVGTGFIRGGVIREEGSNGKLYSFKFNQIEGYKGENPEELKNFSPKGLRAGVLVKFEKAGRFRVRVVRPLVFKG